MPKNTLFVIDAYNLIYRMFYAIPEMHTRAGEPVNAIFGVAKFLRSLATENPDAFVIVANDVGKSFRADIFAEYKGTRDRMPDNLRSQIDGVFSLFAAANIPVIAREGYEADDIIGSIATDHDGDEYQVVIISSDKDLCQFVRDGHVHIFDAMKRKFMKRSDVIEKFGVPPEQVRDYLAIVGDSSDNIPGISGFGPKKAVDLLSKYETLDVIYDHLDDLTAKMREVLIDQRENAFLSQKLAEIVTDIDVDVSDLISLDSLIDTPLYVDILRSYDFHSLLPVESRVAAPTKPALDVVSLETMTALEGLIHSIQSKKSDHITLSVDRVESAVYLAFAGVIYFISLRQVDITDLITAIQDSDIQIVGYHLKNEIHFLESYKNSSNRGVAGQEKLF